MEEGVEGSYVATTSTTSQPAPQTRSDANESLVLSLVVSRPGNSEGDSGGTGLHISPREGLTVAFRSAVEMIESQLLTALLLGIMLAGLMMTGFDKRRIETKAEAAPTPRSYSNSRQHLRPGTAPQR